MEKRCPTCDRKYFEKDLNYCLADGSFLLTPDEFPSDDPAPSRKTAAEPTAVLTSAQSNKPTEVLSAGEETWDSDPKTETSIGLPPNRNKYLPQLLAVGGVLMIVLVGALVGLVFLVRPFSSSADNLNKRGSAGSTTNRNTKTTNTSPPTYSPPTDEDARIQSAAQSALENASDLRDQNIGISVEGGTVILTGSVSSIEQKIRAEAIVKRIKGVKSIDNQISIDP
jgi:hypothetical protein